MQIAACFRRVCYPLSVLIALAGLGTTCHAVSMKVTLGFGGVEKSSVWTPVAVSLSNKSDENVEGVLVMTQPDIDQPPLPACTTQVSLPGHSTKMYHIYIRITGYGGKLRVSLLPRGFGVLASRDVNMQPADTNDRLVVTIGDRAARLSFMQGETINVPPQPRSRLYPTTVATQATIHAGSLLPTELPDRPAAYEAANVIVASGLSPDTVDPNALKALCMWVASGGTLVVSTGADYKAYMNPFYDELLPVKIVGAADLPGMPSLSSMGNTAFPAGPAAVTKATLKPGIGSAMATESGMPLVAERKYGAGRVIFLAFDLRASPFKDWNGQTEFWKSIVRSSTGEPIVATSTGFANDQNPSRSYYPGQDSPGLASVTMQNPSIKTPSVNTIGFFLLAYLIVLVPVNYLLLRRKRRLEMAWVSTPAIVLIFALGAYAIGYTMKGGELRLCECRVIEGSSGARFARAVSNAFVFSPARRSYDLAVADPTAISQVIPLNRDDGAVDTYLGETTAVRDVSIPMWSSKTFEAVGGEDLGGAIETNLKLNGSEVSGTIKNNTSLDLHDCAVHYGNVESGSFTLRKGDVQHIRVAVGKAAPPQSPNYYGAETDIRLRLLQFSRSTAASLGPPTLVGFSSPRQGVFSLPNDRPRAECATCYIFHLDYQTGDTISIPPGMISGSSRGSAPIRPGQNEGMLQGDMYSGSASILTYRLPVLPGFRVTSLRVLGGVRQQGRKTAGGLKVSSDILNCKTGRWEPVNIPSAGPLPSPTSYVSPDNRVTLKVANNQSGGYAMLVTCGLSAEAKRQ